MLRTRVALRLKSLETPRQIRQRYTKIRRYHNAFSTYFSPNYSVSPKNAKKKATRRPLYMCFFLARAAGLGGIFQRVGYRFLASIGQIPCHPLLCQQISSVHPKLRRSQMCIWNSDPFCSLEIESNLTYTYAYPWNPIDCNVVGCSWRCGDQCFVVYELR